MANYFIARLDIILQVTGLTSGRAAALIPVSLGLIGIIIGWISLKVSKKDASKGRLFAIFSLLPGVIALVLSVLHLVRTSDTTIGTGSGKLGAVVALVFGVIGIILGGIAISRAKR